MDFLSFYLSQAFLKSVHCYLWEQVCAWYNLLLQFAMSKWMDSRYEAGLAQLLLDDLVSICILAHYGKREYNCLSKVLFRKDGTRARWVSPDRGLRNDD